MLTKISVGPLDNNAYLLRCRATGSQVLVDAAAEPARLLDLVGAAGLDAVVTTHRHADHWQALEDVAEATGAAVVARTLDADAIGVQATRLVDDDDLIEVGEAELRVIHLAGHTPGGSPWSTTTPRGTSTCSPGTPCSRAAWAARRTAPTSPASSTTSSTSSSGSTRTRRGSTRVTDGTRRSGPSARTWRSGASGAGSPRDVTRVSLLPAGPREASWLRECSHSVTAAVTCPKHPTRTIGPMTNAATNQSKAVAAGTAAGLRHLDRVYVSKVNAMIANDRDDLAHELVADHARLTDHDLGEDNRAKRLLRRVFAA